MSDLPERHFLGWDCPPIARAADWLVEHCAEDLDQRTIALSGARAEHALGEALARRLDASHTPPRIVTVGVLTDELLAIEGETAGRLARTLAWARALRELPDGQLTQLVARPPAKDDLRAWLRLGEEVRANFGELAADGLDFPDALARAEWTAGGERRRFEVLAVAQVAMAAALDDAGLCDPHLARLAALEGGVEDHGRRVVLVGVVDVNRLTRRALEQLGSRLTALVFAPSDEAQRFDELGLLAVEAWSDVELELDGDHWHTVDRPLDQAQCAVEVLSRLGDRYSAADITIGVADPEVSPYLEQRLAQEGIVARDAAGEAFARSAPARLVESLARWLASRSYADYAALVRHPDLEAALRAMPELGELEIARELDRYQREHLPAQVSGVWLGSARRNAPLAAAHEALSELLGELLDESSRPVGEWAGALRDFLVAVYDERLERAAPEARRVGSVALRLIGRALGELEDLPAPLAPGCRASEALDLALRTRRAEAIPARRAGDAPTIELLGWLELALDAAPVLVVTGFVDGRVPEAVHGDAFLPEGLRHSLGLMDNERRLARDLYAAKLMVHSREVAHFITGRRSRSGDPTPPSRLAFRVPEEEIVARVRSWLPPEEEAPPIVALGGMSTYELPRVADRPEPELWRVTSFRDYLRSPYFFYLRHVLKLDSIDDAERELDPPSFGDLAHKVLEGFGLSDVRDATDSGRIAAFLDAELDARVKARFGSAPQAAVQLQREQLRWRLAHFAVKQAERAAEGWRITHVEWQPSSGAVSFEVGTGEAPIQLIGRIDRIDRHVDGRWSILDYKSGEAPPSARPAHQRRDGEFRDLQLPLYAFLATELAQELDLGEPPQLGYVKLGRDVPSIRFDEIEDPDGEWVLSAAEEARRIIREVRKGELFRLEDGPPHDPLWQAVAGIGLLAEAPGDEEEEAS